MGLHYVVTHCNHSESIDLKRFLQSDVKYSQSDCGKYLCGVLLAVEGFKGWQALGRCVIGHEREGRGGRWGRWDAEGESRTHSRMRARKGRPTADQGKSLGQAMGGRSWFRDYLPSPATHRASLAPTAGERRSLSRAGASRTFGARRRPGGRRGQMR